MLWYGNELWKGTGSKTRKTSIVEDKLIKNQLRRGDAALHL